MWLGDGTLTHSQVLKSTEFARDNVGTTSNLFTELPAADASSLWSRWRCGITPASAEMGGATAPQLAVEKPRLAKTGAFKGTWGEVTAPLENSELSLQNGVEGSSAHTNQDHLRTQPRIMRAHKSVSSAHTDQDHLRTRIRTPNQSNSFRWGGAGRGGVGWGGVGIVTNLRVLHGPDNYTGQTFLSSSMFLWVGWGGVGWGQ